MTVVHPQELFCDAAPAPTRELRTAAPRRWLTPSAGFFVVLWLIFMAAGREKLFRDPGTFWHIVLGQRLLNDGELTRYDSFTFTFAGRPWLSLQWLGEAVMALAYQAGGWDTLLLLAATVLAVTYTFLASRLMRAGLHWLPAAVVLAVVLAASSHHFHVRPHLATLSLMALTMAWLCDIEAGRASLRRLAWLVPVFVLWTNLHGGVLGGLGTIGFAAIGWGLLGMLGRGPVRSPKHAILLAALISALGATLLANPYGLDMPRAWLRIMSMPLPDLIQEHRPLSLLRPEGWMVSVLAIAYLSVLKNATLCNPQSAIRNPQSAFQISNLRFQISNLRFQIRVTWLLPLIWLALAVLRVRHAPLFAITAGIALADMLPHTRLWSVVSSQWSAVDGPQRTADNGQRSPRFVAYVATACLILSVMTLQVLRLSPLTKGGLGGGSWPLFGHGWARHDPQLWPVDLLPQLRELERESPGACVFNTLDYGGFLSFHAPQLRTFIDDRCELFGTDFLAAYARAERNEPWRIDDWAEQYGFRLALVRAGSSFDAHLQSSGRWKVVQRATAAALYQRRD